MASPAAVLSILLEANTSSAGRALTQYQGQLQEANKHISTVEQSSGRMGKSIDSVKKPTESATKSLGGLAKAALAAGGAFAAFEAAKDAIDTTVELGHVVERLSAVTGLDTKQASLWIESLKVRGVQSRQVSVAFITLSKNIRNAGDGSKTAKKAFDELGVTQEFLRTHGTQDVLLQTADGLSKITDPANRAAIAQQLFGRGAQALIPVLAGGRKGVDDMLGAAKRYGAFLPNSSKATAGAVEAQRNLKLANDGLKISFTQAVLPALVKAAQGVLGFIAQMRNGQGAGGDFARVISSAFRTVKSVVTGIVGDVGGLGNAVSLLVAAFVASKVIAFGSALRDLMALMKASPIIAVTTVVGFLVTAFSLLSGHQRTAAESARDVANAWDQVRNAGNALRDAHLAVVQANIDITRTSQGVTQAEHEKSNAFDKFGAKSPQYRAATLDLKQAEVDHTEALNRLSDSMHTVNSDQADATSKVLAAISASRGQIAADRDRIASINAHIKALGHQGGQLSQIHDLERQASAATRQLAKDQGNLNDKLNSMPQARLSTIDLNVDFKSNMAGAIAAIAHSIGGQPLSKTPPIPLPAHHFTGGMVTQPGYFAGEEAPQHPEVILATNPAYRQRNLGLFAQAGHMLGVPGFATGGITPSTGNMVTGAPPWASSVSGAWMKGKSNSWLRGIMASIAKTTSAGSSGGPPTGTHVSGNVASWLAQAMALTGVGGPLWTAMLDRQVQNESSGNPLSINLTDSNAAAGHPSKGLLQTIDSTFNRYALPGHGNIWDPVDNAAAAIRYMIANYGHGNAAAAAQVMWARGGGGYRRGGIFGRIPGFKTGGIPGARFTPTLPKAPVKGRLPISVATSPVSSIIGMPALPHIGGKAPTTIAGAQALAGTIGGLHSRITGLTGDYGTLDQYFNLAPPELVDSDGNVVQSAVNQRLAQLNRLVAIRQQIFELWSRLVVYEQRLVSANRTIVANLNTKLAANVATVKGLQTKLKGIKTAGLKGKALTAATALRTKTGKALTAAQAIEASTRSSISKYQGNLSQAVGALTSDTNSRTSSWLDVLDTRSQRAAVAATTGTAAAAADIPTDIPTDTGTGTDVGSGTVDNSAQLALLQTLLTQSQQTAAVANAQFSVLQSWQTNMPPFGGSFATGGIVPGPAGSPRTIIAHGGESVGQAPVVHVHNHFSDGMSWLKRFMRTEFETASRPTARSAARKLPGSR